MRASRVLTSMLLALYGSLQVSGQELRIESSVPRNVRQALVAQAFPDLPPGEPIKCGLGVMAYALRNRSILPPELQNQLSRILQRVERQKTIIAGHFTVHYDTTGIDAPAMLDTAYQRIPGSADQYADSVLAIANQVYAIEVGELGYQPPPTDGTEGGGPEYDIYVESLSSEYAETVPETPLDTKADGGRYITYMRIHNDFSFVRPATNKGLPALRVTLAHEFHHAIQLGSYGYWQVDVFFHEITSTWMEDVVFPGVNDYLNYVRSASGHFRNPDVSFSSNAFIMYSRAIWGHFIAAKFGRDLMRKAWDNIPNFRPLEAMDQALQTRQTTFRMEFTDWVLWNYYTGSRADSVNYYPKGALYPEIAQWPTQFVPPTGILTGSIEPLSSYYHQIYTAADTVTLIECNTNRVAAEQRSSELFSYSISLANSPVDASYEQVGAVLYFKPSTADPSNWKTMKIVGGKASFTGIAEGIPFPNPFRPDGAGLLFIPAEAMQGTLYIYSSSMDLVYSAHEVSTVKFGKSMFTWNGQTRDNNPARSGIYVFVLAIPGKTITGKIALIRN
jgi:hypothetical protein